MKLPASKQCAVCNSTGVAINGVEYPGLEDYRWCESCEEGRAKAEQVAKALKLLSSDRYVKAA